MTRLSLQPWQRVSLDGGVVLARASAEGAAGEQWSRGASSLELLWGYEAFQWQTLAKVA